MRARRHINGSSAMRILFKAKNKVNEKVNASTIITTEPQYRYGNPPPAALVLTEPQCRQDRSSFAGRRFPTPKESAGMQFESSFRQFAAASSARSMTGCVKSSTSPARLRI